MSEMFADGSSFFPCRVSDGGIPWLIKLSISRYSYYGWVTERDRKWDVMVLLVFQDKNFFQSI